MHLLTWCMIGGVSISAGAQRVQAQAAAELTSEQRMTLDEGRQVVLMWDVETSPWPRACVFQRIAASPEEAAAVFTNYGRHVAFIPNVKKAVVSRVVDPVTVEVDYTLAVPVVADEDYTVRDRVSTYNAGASYKIEWTLIRATSTKATEGNVRFEPHRDGALMAYCNLVTPGGRLARLGFVKSRAMAQIPEAARSIVIEVERARARNPERLQVELRTLRSALEAERQRSVP